jgi:quinol monooxygenase YgiN
VTSARMWEAVAAKGHHVSAEEFCRDVVVPAAQAESGCIGVEWFTDGTARVVVISRWREARRAEAWAEPAPAIPLFDRSHAWVFTVGE